MAENDEKSPVSGELAELRELIQIQRESIEYLQEVGEKKNIELKK